jgi:hypothetical protein
MGLNREQWLSQIQEALREDNSIINKAINHDSFVKFKTVHVPQAGSDPNLVKNRSSFPAAIGTRTDSELTYSVDTYYVDPIHIEKGEETSYLSYDKRASVLRTYTDVLNESITNNALYKWAPSGAARQVRTSGSASATALAGGATGNRKAITIADILAAKQILDADNVSQEGRILMLPSSIYNTQLLAIADIYQQQSYGQSALPSGVVARIHGFNIMIRNNVVVYDNTGTPVIKTVNDKGVVSTTATSDNLGILAFHPNYVCRAYGSIDVMINENVAEYYGSIITSMVGFGASKLRNDQKGVAAIIQAA